MSRDMYKAYDSWAYSNGINRKLIQKNVTQRLERLGFKRGRGTGGVRLIMDIAIKKFCDAGAYANSSKGWC